MVCLPRSERIAQIHTACVARFRSSVRSSSGNETSLKVVRNLGDASCTLQYTLQLAFRVETLHAHFLQWCGRGVREGGSEQGEKGRQDCGTDEVDKVMKAKLQAFRES